MNFIENKLAGGYSNHGAEPIAKETRNIDPTGWYI